MIWLDSLVLGCLCAAALCEMNGIYTSMVFRRNECCFHVRRAVVLETDSLSGARRYLLVVQYWEDSERPSLFHLLLCSFCCFTALFPEGTVLLLINLCFLCSKDLLPFVIKSDFRANWEKPCLWPLVVLPFRQDIMSGDCRVHSYLLLTTATIVMMSAALEKKKLWLFLRRLPPGFFSTAFCCTGKDFHCKLPFCQFHLS